MKNRQTVKDEHKKDYKTLLQEYVQKRFKNYPRYVVAKRTGPDHDRVFWMEVEVNGRTYGPGKGSNKKQAEQAAAAMAYKSLTSNPSKNRSKPTEERQGGRQSRPRSRSRRQGRAS